MPLLFLPNIERVELTPVPSVEARQSLLPSPPEANARDFPFPSEKCLTME